MKSSLDTTLRTLPQRPGVYLFRDRRESALYVGRAAQLRRRVRSYWGPLEGDPNELAVATERLIGMRDAASARLAYEFAAEVQTRVASLAWIVDAPYVSRGRRVAS